MKIYTKTGDKGETSKLNGSRVSKDGDLIECVGSIDEATSAVGIVKAKLQKKSSNLRIKKIILKLSRIQEHFIQINAYLISLPDTNDKYKIEKTWTKTLEKEIDAWEENLEQLKEFILPGKSETEAFIHLVRSIIRRAERRIITLNKSYNIDEDLLAYINRLSDWFFVLARVIS